MIYILIAAIVAALVAIIVSARSSDSISFEDDKDKKVPTKSCCSK